MFKTCELKSVKKKNLRQNYSKQLLGIVQNFISFKKYEKKLRENNSMFKTRE